MSITLASYLDLKYSTNTKDTASSDKAKALDTQHTPKLAFIENEIQKIAPTLLQQYLTSYPPLQVYRYVLEEAIRWRPYTLSLQEEELLAKTGPLMAGWQEEQYIVLMDRAPWGKVHDPETGEELDVRQHKGRIANSAHRKVRREGFEKTNTAYREQRDLFAFLFINFAKSQNKLAQLRSFKNGQDTGFFSRHLDYADVENAYNQILSHGVLFKRFEQLRRDRIQSFTGYDVVHVYDETVVPPGVVKPRFTIDEATRVIKESTAYLGPEYNEELAHLLDPANGRLDIVGGPNRVPNAFAKMLTGTQSVFYSYAYEGYVDDVKTLAHEAGHSVHQSLLNNAKIPYALAAGPGYFTESFAILNELVLLDQLYHTETDRGRKVYYLEQLLFKLLRFLYGSTRTAAIEKAVYEDVDKGIIQTADDLDALTYQLSSRISIWFDIDSETKNFWQALPHYYNNPAYYVNYVFAELLAQTYFAMYKKDAVGFAKRFTALMRNGFNDTPLNLLKKFLNIDLQDPQTYDAVFSQHEAYLSDLAQLYKQVPVPLTQTDSTQGSRR